jgi:hypothetical protein
VPFSRCRLWRNVPKFYSTFSSSCWLAVCLGVVTPKIGEVARHVSKDTLDVIRVVCSGRLPTLNSCVHISDIKLVTTVLNTKFAAMTWGRLDWEFENSRPQWRTRIAGFQIHIWSRESSEILAIDRHFFRYRPERVSSFLDVQVTLHVGLMCDW